VFADTVLADTGSFLSPMFIYDVPVSCSYTLYRYVVKHDLYVVQLSSG
jgi:inorganic pyrophosphatase/exopolyphosphatase